PLVSPSARRPATADQVVREEADSMVASTYLMERSFSRVTHSITTWRKAVREAPAGWEGMVRWPRLGLGSRPGSRASPVSPAVAAPGPTARVPEAPEAMARPDRAGACTFPGERSRSPTTRSPTTQPRPGRLGPPASGKRPEQARLPAASAHRAALAAR